MKRSLAAGAGFVEVDHTNSPGLSLADVAHVTGAQPVAGGTKFEADVLQCQHCQRAVLKQPLRTRPRGYCPKCDGYLCDLCEGIRVQSGACVPIAQVFDTAQAIAEKYAGQPDHPGAAALLDMAALSAPRAPRVVLTDWKD